MSQDFSILEAGVADAKVSAHRLRLLIHRVLQQFEQAPDRQHLFEIAGESIQAAPQVLDALDRNLDKAQYTVLNLQRDRLRKEMPQGDLQAVDRALDSVPNVSSKTADLDPQLGWPGGRCQVVERIEDKAPRRTDLMNSVEHGTDLSNTQATNVYSPRVEAGDGMFRHMVLTAHAQYRMDLRGVTAPHLRALLREVAAQYSREKSQGNDQILRNIQSREGWQYTSHKSGLVAVLHSPEPKVVNIVSCWWAGEPDPHPTSCRHAFQHIHRGPDKLKSQRYYRTHRALFKRRALKRYNRLKHNSTFRRHQMLYRKNPNRFRRRLGSEGFSFWWEPRQEVLVITQVTEAGRLQGLLGSQPATVSLEAFQRGAAPLNPQQLEDFLQMLDRAFEAETRTAAKLSAIQDGMDPAIADRARGYKPQLARVNPARNQWLFRVGDHEVKIRAEGRGRPINRHLKVQCSCPAWQWSGAEYWASQGGYLLGKPRGTVTEPKIRDPGEQNRLCKHAVACLQVLRGY